MVNELSASFVIVANSVGGVDVKVAVTVVALDPTHAGRVSVVDSLM
jgi:hypothetical protein